MTTTSKPAPADEPLLKATGPRGACCGNCYSGMPMPQPEGKPPSVFCRARPAVPIPTGITRDPQTGEAVAINTFAVFPSMLAIGWCRQHEWIGPDGGPTDVPPPAPH